MATEYFYLDEQQEKARGPFSLEQMCDLFEVGVLNANTRVAEGGASEWLAAADVPVFETALYRASGKSKLTKNSNYSVAETEDFGEPVDPKQLLEQNVFCESKLKGTPPPTLKNRSATSRSRDYWVAMLAVNAVLAIVLIGFVGSSPYLMVPILSFAVLFNIGLPWLLFVVMDRY